MLLYHLYWTEEFFSDDCDLNLKKFLDFKNYFDMDRNKTATIIYLHSFFVVFENWNIEKCDWPKNMLFSWSSLVLSGWIFYFHILKLKFLLLPLLLVRWSWKGKTMDKEMYHITFICQSMYKIVMQFLESFNFIHLIQRELISKKWYILKLLQSYKQFICYL